MKVRKIIKIFFLIFAILILIYLIYSKNNKTSQITQIDDKIEEDNSYSSNIIREVNYTSIDTNGNEYIINALKGEIDYSKSNILYLTDVTAVIKLKNSEKITITSDYGKYNSENFDTIFSKNVIVKYLQNKISGEYLDFSLERNLMIISRDVVYANLKNILKADVVEMNLKTKDTKIFMYENKKKVNIRSRN